MGFVLITINIVDFFPSGKSAPYYVGVSCAVAVYLASVVYVATRPVPKIHLKDAPKLTQEEKKLQVRLDYSDGSSEDTPARMSDPFLKSTAH